MGLEDSLWWPQGPVTVTTRACHGDHKGLSPVPILSQIVSVHALPSSFFKKYFNITAPSTHGLTIRTMLIFTMGNLAYLEAGRLTPRQLSATAYCYVPYLDAVHSVRNLRARGVVVTRANFTWQRVRQDSIIKSLPLFLLLLLSALQLFVSFGLLNYFFPLFPLLRRLFPIIHSRLPQVIPHIVLPSYSWSSLRSCCIRLQSLPPLPNSKARNFRLSHENKKKVKEGTPR